MGCEYFECEECKECNCDFAICSFCENKTYKCLYCVEEMHHLIYNVIFYSEVNDKYGNLNYKFICDDCISIDINDLYKNIKDEELLKLKETILNKKKIF